MFRVRFYSDAQKVWKMRKDAGGRGALQSQTTSQVVIPFCGDTPPDGREHTVWKAALVTVPRPFIDALHAALDPWARAFYVLAADLPTVGSMRGASASWLTAARDFVRQSGGAVDVVPLDRECLTWLDFPPHEIVKGLRVAPAGKGHRSDDGTVVLHPGLSYGDGRHPTTATCAQAIHDLARQERPQSLVDVGCGSGILALVAVRVGIPSVVAVDIDPYARHVAAKNLLANGVHGEVLSEIPPRHFDVVVANIWPEELLEMSPSLMDAVEPDGTLVVSGIRREQESGLVAWFRGFQVRARYKAHGWSTVVMGRAKRGLSVEHACGRA